MSNDPLEKLLRQWNDAGQRSLSRRGRSCDDGPSLASLYLHVVEGLELSAEQARHLGICPECSQLLERIERRAAAGTFPPVLSGGLVIRHSAEASGESRRIHQLSRRPRSPSPLSRRRWAIGGSLAAASVLIALLLWPFNGNHRAVAAHLQEVGFAPPMPGTAAWPDPDDESVRQASQAVAEARVELEEALSIGQRDILDPWIPWTKLYRHLRVLGKWEEALSETHAFVEFAREQDQEPDRYSMYYSGLFDLANTYAALGDYSASLIYHQESLTVARDYQEWHHARIQPESQPPLAFAREMTNTLVPRLWALSTLAAAEEYQKAAWSYHDEARDLLTDYFRQECWHRGLHAAPEASLADIAGLVVADSDEGVESMVVKVREHLLRRAMLFRLDRDLDAATQALDINATLPDYPFADESRLDFNEPMERLRIAIARGDFAAALATADEARQYTGSRHFPIHPDNPPIGLIARAELQFLRGVVLAGLNANNPEALNLIESGLEAVSESAAALPEPQRERFLKRFLAWEECARRVRE